MWVLAALFAVGAAYIYEKIERSSEELAIVCVAVALLGVVLTLIAAPWPIHLLLVVVLLASRLSRVGALDS